MKNQTLSEFSIDNSARSIYLRLTTLGKFIKKGKARYFEKCKIIVAKRKIIIRVEGSEFYIPANPTREVILDVYYTDLKEVLENDRSANMICKVKDITLEMNNRKIPCEVSKLKKKEFDIEAGLGLLNFGGVNTESVSWQKEIYTLKSKNKSIHVDTIRRDAEKAALLLKKYKIDPDKIFCLLIDYVK